MGVVDSLILLAGLGGMMYYMTYYILPQLGAMQQAYAQPQIQYIPQQQAPAPEPTYIPEEPVDTAALELPPNGTEIENEAAEDSEEQALELPEGGSEIENEADEDEESEDERRSREEDELKEEHEEQKKRREEYDEETDPKKDTRYKGMSSREAGRAAARALGLQHFVYADVSRPYKIRGYYFDRTGNLRYRF